MERKLESERLTDLEGKLEPDVVKETGFKNIIIIDNIPQVEASKIPKLQKVLAKICAHDDSLHENALYLPTDSAGKTLGFAFVEYPRPEKAAQAVERLNGYKLDKNHIFVVNSYEDFDKYLNISETYVTPKITDVPEIENLRSWLLDSRAMDQYAIRWANETEIYWNDTTILPPNKPTPIISKSHWTESLIYWSPEGSYLATLHNQGIILWGGSKWSKIVRFQHPGVKLIHFSPKENYLVTLSSAFAETDTTKDPQSIIIWDIRSGKKLRGFPGGQSNQWPIFQWSFDDKYFARLGTDLISVYETPSMSLIEKKSIPIPGVKDFAWSPTEHLLSCWVPEQGNSAARILLMEIPSRKVKSQRNLLNVSDCKLHWQTNGEFLCVKVDKHSKTKKSTFTAFEIFRINEKDVPVEVIETKGTIVAFSWEPKGNRLAVIHGEGPRPDISFYEVQAKKVVCLGTLEKRQANHLFWSPQGQFIVLAGLKQFNGVLEFFNVADMETLATGEHFLCTDIEWDPTGRFLATYVSHWRHPSENGYNIWSFFGRLVSTTPREKFYQLYWRPRPASLLTDEQEQEIQNNLKTISKKLAALDSKENEAAKESLAKQRKQLKDEWVRYLEKNRQIYEEQRKNRESLRGYPSDPESNYEVIEDLVEEVIEETSEVI